MKTRHEEAAGAELRLCLASTELAFLAIDMPALPGVSRSEKKDEAWREGSAGGSYLPRMSGRQGCNWLLGPTDLAWLPRWVTWSMLR